MQANQKSDNPRRLTVRLPGSFVRWWLAGVDAQPQQHERSAGSPSGSTGPRAKESLLAGVDPADRHAAVGPPLW